MLENCRKLIIALPLYAVRADYEEKLCGEEDCKRCGDLDLDQPCIGKTDCSICHSSTGVLCRACLLIRYGEELEEVRANKQWACPHCIEDEGTRPYWICNSSLCLKRRKMVPTGIAIYTARKMGYKSSKKHSRNSNLWVHRKPISAKPGRLIIAQTLYAVRAELKELLFLLLSQLLRRTKLCGEEDCKKCGNLDRDQPCIGKTDCSICHSSTGIFCRGCLKVRYGEELEEVRADKQWACPHCIEEKGIRPYWICNSFLCLKKRNMVQNHHVIWIAKRMGYKSVAHLLMDKLKQDERMMMPRSVLNLIILPPPLFPFSSSNRSAPTPLLFSHHQASIPSTFPSKPQAPSKIYEEIRQARIQENKIKLATLGVQKTLSQLKSLGPQKRKAPRKIDYSSNPLRQKGLAYIGRRKSPTYGFFCHFCRRQKRCVEKDCKRCGDLDRDQPCTGKTECSICHSSTGIFCRDCLKVRYGEELEEVRADKLVSSHQIEEKGTKPLLDTKTEEDESLMTQYLPGGGWGRQILDIDYPEGPFGTKEAPSIIKSYYDKRIVGCPGGEGEDEHDVVWFWLEKGQTHDCPVCSQHFALEVVGPGGPPDGHGDDDHH
ncbi:hypothetical protein Leryth_007087 [Lithospermum erythrorhizon]|nr:hypothetical protein Leryth_007087 [Lithospermum erythrorhizon]